MTADQETLVNQLIVDAQCATKEAREAKRTYSVLIKTFAVAIFIAVSSVSVLVYKMIVQEKDIEYVRSHAVSIEAFQNLIDAQRANNQALINLIGDPDIQDVANNFNTQIDEVIDRIISSQTEIVPRGAVEANRGSNK